MTLNILTAGAKTAVLAVSSQLPSITYAENSKSIWHLLVTSAILKRTAKLPCTVVTWGKTLQLSCASVPAN